MKAIILMVVLSGMTVASNEAHAKGAIYSPEGMEVVIVRAEKQYLSYCDAHVLVIKQASKKLFVSQNNCDMPYFYGEKGRIEGIISEAQNKDQKIEIGGSTAANFFKGSALFYYFGSPIRIVE